MKHIFGSLVGAYVLCLFFLVPRAEAIDINYSQLSGGDVIVAGTGAVPFASILWEGSAVTTANKAGNFSFKTAVVPSDCLGELSDGATTVQVGVGRCTTTETGGGGGVLATGQTTSFQAGDDGDLELGIARTYTDNGDGTITDNATGLMWEKLTDDGTIHDKDNLYTWANAFAVKIADLNTANFAGHNDWRLPNINELQTLANYGTSDPAIDPAFNNGVDSFTQSPFYWSSTTYAFFPINAWSVDFFDGTVNPILDKTGFFFVRAVRGS